MPPILPITPIASDVSPIELVPENYFEPLNLASVFAARSPLEVDVGSGDGSFLVAIAQKNPGQVFLGIERLLGRVRKTCRKAARLNLTNVRVLRLESVYAVRNLIPPESVTVFHVSFPDPWPKRKHHRRRLVNHEFLDAVYAALCADGQLRLTTDDADYFAHMRRVLSERVDFAETLWPEDPDYPQTDFEKKFRGQGLPIHRLLVRKINSPG